MKLRSGVQIYYKNKRPNLRDILKMNLTNKLKNKIKELKVLNLNESDDIWETVQIFEYIKQNINIINRIQINKIEIIKEELIELGNSFMLFLENRIEEGERNDPVLFFRCYKCHYMIYRVLELLK